MHVFVGGALPKQYPEAPVRGDGKQQAIVANFCLRLLQRPAYHLQEEVAIPTLDFFQGSWNETEPVLSPKV